MRNKVIDLLDQTIEELDKETIDGILEIPPKDDMGDFAFPCFQLAKVFRKAPNMIATEIAEKIPASEDVSKVEAMGPYVNFFLNKENYVKEVLAKVNGTYGAQEIGKGKTVCIDYSSPNIAKNFHVGHLRTTIIGNSLYHIFDKLGYKVERINHLGDWGTQFGKLIVAYKKWGSKEAVEEKGIPELLRIYVKFHEEAEKDDTLNDQAREWFAKMEQGDEEALSIWEWFKDISMVEYKRIYKMLNMDFDHYTGESFYRDKTAAVVEVNSETDFVAKNEKFQNYVADVAAQAMNTTAADIDAFLAETWKFDETKTVNEALAGQIAIIGENMNIRRFQQVKEDAGFVASYTHMGGKIGVLVDVATDVVNADIEEMAKNVCMQVAALNPKYTDRSEVDQDYLAKEEEILTAAAKNEKPDANDKIITGMVKGRLNKELKEICLMDQVYVKAEDGKQSVSKYVEEVAKANNAKIAIKGFVRMETGEGIEKKEEDFAAEVAAQMNA